MSSNHTISPSSFGIKRTQSFNQPNKFNSLNSRNYRPSYLEIEESLNSTSSSSISPQSNPTRRNSLRTEAYISNIINQKPIPPNRTSSLNYKAQPIYAKKNSDDRHSIYSTYSVRSNQPYLNTLNFETSNLSTLLTSFETNKIESCYKSIGSNVLSSKCQAGLYITNLQSLINLTDWKLEVTGVPVWVFNTGLNPKRPKGLYFYIADKKTGFSLWRSNPITFVNDFKWTRPGLITFKIKDNNKKGVNEQKFAAIRFDDELECSKFYDFYRRLFVDSNNDDLFNPHYKVPKKIRFCSTIVKRITKNSISSPVAFNHVNSLSVVFEESFSNTTRSTSSSSSTEDTSDTQSIRSEFTVTFQNRKS